jgi:hypothetical protein
MEWQDEYSVGMGTAMEGPQQGQVRLHIEIAPDGKIAVLKRSLTLRPEKKSRWGFFYGYPACNREKTSGTLDCCGLQTQCVLPWANRQTRSRPAFLAA